MKRLILPILIILLVSSCKEGSDKGNKSTLQKDIRTDKEIENLIAKNDSNLVFLSFWEGINDRDFKRVKNIETKKRILDNGQFILQVPHTINNILFNINFVGGINEKYDTEYDGAGFSINISDKVIELKHEDSYFEKYEGKVSNPENDGSLKIGVYESVIKYLIKLFDEKYKRIIVESNQKQYSWIKTLPNKRSIVIILFPNYWYYTKGYLFVENRKRNYDNRFGYTSPLFGIDTVNKRYCLATSNIKIRYEKYETYCKEMLSLKAKLKKEKDDKDAEIKGEKEAKDNMLNTIKRNNNKL